MALDGVIQSVDISLPSFLEQVQAAFSTGMVKVANLNLADEDGLCNLWPFGKRSEFQYLLAWFMVSAVIFAGVFRGSGTLLLIWTLTEAIPSLFNIVVRFFYAIWSAFTFAIVLLYYSFNPAETTTAARPEGKAEGEAEGE